MTEDSNDNDPTTPIVPDSSLVTRSVVEPGLPYKSYREALRRDFFHSCAYCTMSEAEATAIRFTIDHYEPRTLRPDLVNAYENLMYACDECNLRKGNRAPPEEARADGFRFFRPDHDVHSDHFRIKGILLESKSNIGHYSIEAIDLNRASLRKLRQIRDRLTACDKLVAAGVLGLRRIPIDQLPTHLKGTAAAAIARASTVGGKLADEIDKLLREYARSSLIDPAPESEQRAKERATKLNDLRILYAGSWRAPRAAASHQASKSSSGRRKTQ